MSADAGKPAPTKRSQDWTAEEKRALVTEAATLPKANSGRSCAAKGVHEAQLAEWRVAAVVTLQPPNRREHKAASLERDGAERPEPGRERKS